MRIVRITRLTPTISSFLFDGALAFVPGQHVDVRLTAEDGYRAERSYSIASAPGDPVELAIERLPDGEVSGFFHEIARVGDDIELLGPRGGHFTWEPGHGPALLVAGGSGVVPFVSMLRHRATVGSDVPIALLVAARSAGHVPFREELSGAEFVFARSEPLPVRRLLARLGPPAAVYVCGSNGFVNAATDAILEEGVRPQIVRTERYG